MPSRARKPWDQLTPTYRRRLERGGITRQNYETADRKAARGHATTPEHPRDAERHPGQYRDYITSRTSDERQVIARKERIWGTSPRFDPGRSAQMVRRNPRTKSVPSLALMRRFLRMSDDEVSEIDWSDDDWAFLFYH